MLMRLLNLDRRWIFAMMLIAVAVPILFQWKFPEKPSGLAQSTFDELDNLPAGAKVYMAFDYDPASAGELSPMATSFTRHACELARDRGIKIYFATLWPAGVPMIQGVIDGVIRKDFPELTKYDDWMNLGFKNGEEGVIKVVATDLRQMYTADADGTPLDEIPMMEGIKSIRDFDLIVNVSAGFPGTKEWILYAVTPFAQDIDIIAGCTGVQAPLLYPYIPKQLPGLLGAIKGAAEYEDLVLQAYGRRDDAGNLQEPGKYLEAKRRMGPQLIAHVLMILLIVAGNVLYFTARKKGLVS